jgi:hypothetical protein
MQASHCSRNRREVKEPKPSEREKEEVERDREVKERIKKTRTQEIANGRVNDGTYEANHSSSAS